MLPTKVKAALSKAAIDSGVHHPNVYVRVIALKDLNARGYKIGDFEEKEAKER